jgi:hypothetical protein
VTQTPLSRAGRAAQVGATAAPLLARAVSLMALMREDPAVRRALGDAAGAMARAESRARARLARALMASGAFEAAAQQALQIARLGAAGAAAGAAGPGARWEARVRADLCREAALGLLLRRLPLTPDWVHPQSRQAGDPPRVAAAFAEVLSAAAPLLEAGGAGGLGAPGGGGAHDAGDELLAAALAECAGSLPHPSPSSCPHPHTRCLAREETPVAGTIAGYDSSCLSRAISTELGFLDCTHSQKPLALLTPARHARAPPRRLRGGARAGAGPPIRGLRGGRARRARRAAPDGGSSCRDARRGFRRRGGREPRTTARRAHDRGGWRPACAPRPRREAHRPASGSIRSRLGAI